MRKFYFILTLLVVFAGACKKETGIGADLLPGNDLLNAKNTDTFTLNTKTIADTAMRSDKLSKVYLGVINDPIFGFQKASFAIELDRGDVIYDDTLKPIGGYIIDSAVLFIKYSGIYGDSLIAQDFNVSSISSPINENSAYYSNNTSFTASSLLGSVSNYKFVPSQKTVLSTTDTAGTALIFRVKLNDGFFQSLINLPASQLRDSIAFKNYFPGILVENSSAAGNAQFEMDLSSANSNVTIFYKDKYAKQKTMKLKTSELAAYNGAIISRQNGVNLFSNTLSSTVQNVIGSGLVSDSINYLLGQSGSIVRISMPTIGNLGKVAVNKAVLSVTQIINNSQKDFFLPANLYLLKRNSTGQIDYLPTYPVNESNQIYVEGKGVADSVGVDAFGNRLIRYRFNITQYLQKIALGTEQNTDLFIGTTFSAGTDGTINLLNLKFQTHTPYRFILAGSNYSNPNFKTKLNITYTLIK